ncbi:MAG: hypothetical protein KJZ84_23960 [Bryobacteraceae bacterium]|nr:hypothetical protein [Bryobacteraceae bacterium]
MKAICSVPVQIYDEGLAGVYRAGQVIDGAAARRLAERYPEYFRAVEKPSKPAKAGESEPE